MAINSITRIEVTSSNPSRIVDVANKAIRETLAEAKKDQHYDRLDDLTYVFNLPAFVKSWVRRERRADKTTRNLTILAKNRDLKAAEKALAIKKSKTPKTPAVLYCQIPGTDQFKKVPLDTPINHNNPNQKLMERVQKEADHMNHEEMRDAWQAAIEDYEKRNGKEWVEGTIEGLYPRAKFDIKA